MQKCKSYCLRKYSASSVKESCAVFLDNSIFSLIYISLSYPHGANIKHSDVLRLQSKIKGEGEGVFQSRDILIVFNEALRIVLQLSVLLWYVSCSTLCFEVQLYLGEFAFFLSAFGCSFLPLLYNLLLTYIPICDQLLPPLYVSRKNKNL